MYRYTARPVRDACVARFILSASTNRAIVTRSEIHTAYVSDSTKYAGIIARLETRKRRKVRNDE
jgi:hypothetical protein